MRQKAKLNTKSADMVYAVMDGPAAIALQGCPFPLEAFCIKGGAHTAFSATTQTKPQSFT